MSDLHHKSRLLHEERDYYTALFTTSQRAFEEHRHELSELIEKERLAHARREEDLRAELAAIRANVTRLEGEVAEAHGRSSAKVQSVVEQIRRESNDTEHRLRLEIERVQAQLADERRRTDATRADLQEFTESSRELNDRQTSLKARIQRLTEESYARAAAMPKEVPGSSASAGSRRSPQRCPAPFIPSGAAVRPGKTADVVTHNAYALAATVRKANVRSPRREAAVQGTADNAQSIAVLATNDATQLRAIRQSLESELVDLRAEHDHIANGVDDLRYASGGVTRKLQELSEAIADKTAQLDAVSTAANRLDAAFRLSRMMDESRRRNDECDAVHATLLDVVHSKSE